MNPELQAIYQDVIIDHGRHPRNHGELEASTHTQRGYNPVCGDELTVYVVVENDCVSDVKLKGQGCAISMASASLMTEWLKGKTLTETKQQFKQFQQLLTQADANIDTEKLGKIAILEGVKAYPMRVKCATLAWHTLNTALSNDAQSVTTE